MICCGEQRETPKTSDKRREQSARYEASAKGRGVRAAYRHSAKGQAVQAKYTVSPKGRATTRRHAAKRRLTQKYRAYQAAYRVSEKGRAAQAKFRASAKAGRGQAKYIASDRGRATRAKYDASDKGRSAARAKCARRRALIRGVTCDEAEQIKAFYHQAQVQPRLRCFYCGRFVRKADRHVDHIVPLAKGGLHTLDNLAVACAKCNLKKHAKRPVQVGLLPMFSGTRAEASDGHV